MRKWLPHIINNSFHPKLLGGFVLIITLLLLVFTTFDHNHKESVKYNEWVSVTKDVILESEEAFSDFKDIESTVKGYVITRNKDILKQYAKSCTSTLQHLATLKELTKDNIEQNKRINILSEFVVRKIDYSNKLINFVDENNNETAKILINTVENSRLLNRINFLIPSIQAIESRIYDRQKEIKERDLNNTSKTVYLLEIMVILILIIVFIFLEASFRARRRAENNLHHLNNQLDLLVKQRTLSLEISEEKYRTVVENIHDAIIIIDNDGHLKFTNSNFLSVFKLTTIETEQLKLEHVIAPEYIEEIQMSQTLISSGQEMETHLECIAIRKNRKTFWCEMSMVPLSEKNIIIGTQCCIRDISERKRVEEELVRREYQFRALVDNSFDGVMVLDENGYAIFSSPASVRISGYTKEDRQKLSLIEIVISEHQEIVHTLMDNLMEFPGVTFPFQYMIKRKDGSRFWSEGKAINLLNDGSIEGIVINFHDITEEKIARDQLEQNEKKYRHIFELNPVPMWLADIDTFKFLDVNNATVAHYGYTKEEMLTMTALDIRPETDREKFLAVRRNTKVQLEKRGIWEHRKKDGTNIFVDIIVSEIEYNGKLVSLVSANDLTLRIQAEQKIKQSEKLYKTIASNIPGSVIALLDNNLNYLLLEGDLIERLGYVKENVLGKNITEVLPPEHVLIVNKGYVNALSGKSTTEELIIEGYDLTTKLIPLKDEENNVYAIMSVSQDVTDLKNVNRAISELSHAAEQKVIERTASLKKSNELFENLFDHNPASLTINDEATGKLVNCNESFLSFFGYKSKAEVLNKSFIELRLHLAIKQVLTDIIQMKENDIIKNKEVFAINKKGEIKWFNTSILKIKIEGKPSFLSVSIDITEQKKAEEQLTSAIKELDSFSYSVSHDLRAPLRSISGFSQILRESHASLLDEEGQRYLNIISENTLKMGNLIDDLLAFSRLGKQNLHKKLINMEHLVNIIVKELIEDQKITNVELKFNKFLEVYADVSLIHQVMVNLISNALKYSSKKEKILIEINSYKEKNQIIYYVRDNGVGFDMQYYDKLFAVFQRLHRTRDFSGTGVGLSIAHRIITKHDGKMWAESKVNEGATFYFSLPIININSQQV